MGEYSHYLEGSCIQSLIWKQYCLFRLLFLFDLIFYNYGKNNHPFITYDAIF